MPAALASIVLVPRAGRAPRPATRTGSRPPARARRSLLVVAAIAALTGGGTALPGPATETPSAEVRVAPFRWEPAHRTTA